MIKLTIEHNKGIETSKILRSKMRYRAKKFFDAWDKFKSPHNKVKEFAIEQEKFKTRLLKVAKELNLDEIHATLSYETPTILAIGDPCIFEKEDRYGMVITESSNKKGIR
jgi:hypothetical protein